MEFDITEVNLDPRKGQTFDPDMNLMCLWCGKDYKPYNNLVIHDFAFLGFCSIRCFKKYYSIPGKLWRTIIYPFWWVRSRFLLWNDARYAEPCPCCGELMLTMTKDIQCCMNKICEMSWMTMRVTSHKNHEIEFMFEEDRCYVKKEREGSKGEGKEKTSKKKARREGHQEI